MQSLFGAKRIILRGFQPPDRPAMRTYHRTDGCQRVQVCTNRNCGNGEARDQVRDRNLAILVHQIQHTSTPLFCEKPRLRGHAPCPLAKYRVAEPKSSNESIIAENTFVCFLLISFLCSFLLRLLFYCDKSLSRLGRCPLKYSTAAICVVFLTALFFCVGGSV